MNSKNLDPIVAVLKLKRPPIIWSFGVPTKTLLPTRKKFGKKFAIIFGFKYINLDDQILKWLKQLQNPTDQITPSNKVFVYATENMNVVIFQLYEFSIPLKIVPTHSKGKKSLRKEEDDFVTYHIIEQLSRKKVIDLLTFAMYDNLPAKGYFIDGFPKDKTDVLHFEKTFYKTAAAIYWTYGDCSEKTSTTEIILPSVNRKSGVKKSKPTSTEKNDLYSLINSTISKKTDTYAASYKGIDPFAFNSVFVQIPEGKRTTRSTPTRGDKTKSLNNSNVTTTSLKLNQSSDWENKETTLKTSKTTSNRLKVSWDVSFFDTQKKSTKIIQKEPWQGYFRLGNSVNSSKSTFPQLPSIGKAKLLGKSSRAPPGDLSLIEFPICARRYGYYSCEENEIIVKYYGQRAIKLIGTDLLLANLDRLTPKFTEILEKSIKILLRKYASDPSTKSRSNMNKSGSNESINFSVNAFKFKPAYPGAPSKDRNPRKNLKCRKIHPLQLHHENTKEPTIISIQEIIDLDKSCAFYTRPSHTRKVKFMKQNHKINSNTPAFKASNELNSDESLLSFDEENSEIFLYRSDTSIQIRHTNIHKQKTQHSTRKRKSIMKVASKILKLKDSFFSKKNKKIEETSTDNTELIEIDCRKRFQENEIQRGSNFSLTKSQLDDIKNKNYDYPAVPKSYDIDPDKNGNFGCDFPLQPDRKPENFVVQNISIEENTPIPQLHTDDPPADTQSTEMESKASPIVINLLDDKSDFDLYSAGATPSPPYKRHCRYHINNNEEYEQKEIKTHNWAPTIYPMSTGQFKSQFHPGETKERFLSFFEYEMEMNNQKKVEFNNVNETFEYSNELDTTNVNLMLSFDTGHQNTASYIDICLAVFCFCFRRKRQ